MACKQEMPPQGGYSPIIYQRVPLKMFFKPIPTLATIFCIWAAGWSALLYTKRKHNIERIEMRCASQALAPMIIAEADRVLLKQLKKNRDYEEKIMKDVEGWEVGKWKHQPVFLTLGPDEFFKPHTSEFYAHTDKKFTDEIISLFLFV